MPLKNNIYSLFIIGQNNKGKFHCLNFSLN